MFFRMVYKSGQIFLPFCHNTRVWQTGRQTDRILITIPPRLHYMQRGKNSICAVSCSVSKMEKEKHNKMLILLRNDECFY